MVYGLALQFEKLHNQIFTIYNQRWFYVNRVKKELQQKEEGKFGSFQLLFPTNNQTT